MKFETEAGTDIAMIGIWDADASNGEIPFKRFMDELSKDGKEGKLLRVDTGADGSYSICVISTLEELRTFELDAHAKIEHDFFLESKSGAFIAGGIEDYRNGTPQITSKDDLFKIEPGAFRVHAYVHNAEEEQISKQVETITGVEDLMYRDWSHRPWGCSSLSLELVGASYGDADGVRSFGLLFEVERL